MKTKVFARLPYGKNFTKQVVYFVGYLPSGLHARALTCSLPSHLRKSARIYRIPVPLDKVPTKEAAPDRTDAAFPG